MGWWHVFIPTPNESNRHRERRPCVRRRFWANSVKHAQSVRATAKRYSFFTAGTQRKEGACCCRCCFLNRQGFRYDSSYLALIHIAIRTWLRVEPCQVHRPRNGLQSFVADFLCFGVAEVSRHEHEILRLPSNILREQACQKYAADFNSFMSSWPAYFECEKFLTGEVSIVGRSACPGGCCCFVIHRTYFALEGLPARAA